MRARPFISLVRFSAHVRAFVTSPNTTLEPIRFRDRIQTALFCTDTSSHFSMIGHTCEMYVYSRQIANVSRRASRGYNIWETSLTELCHVARPSQRVIVVLYCVVLCVINRFPARSRSAFPDVATWKSLSNVGGRVINRNGEARFVPPVPPLFLVSLVYCVTSWIYPMQPRLNNFEVRITS